MLDLLGMIGKGIGITLLCILILLIAALLSVLFVPLRYRLAGRKETEGRPEGDVRIHWLFHIVTCFVRWQGALHYGLKICGISVYDNLRKAEKEKQEKRQKKEKKQKKQKKKKQKQANKERAGKKADKLPEATPLIREVTATAPEPQKASPNTATAAGAESSDSVPGGQPPEDDAAGKAPQASLTEGKTPEAGEHKKHWPGSIVQKIRAFIRKLADLLRKIRELPARLAEKAAHCREAVAYYIAFLQREDLKRAFDLCRRELYYLWRKFRPRKVKADIHFGFADPATTGQVMAFAGMMYPFLGKDIVIRPDFEEQVFCANAVIKGKITIFCLLKALAILYFNKDIKRLIRIWKKEEL